MQEAWKALLNTLLAGTERVPLPENIRWPIPMGSAGESDRALEQMTALYLLRKTAAPLKPSPGGLAPAADERLPACPPEAAQSLAKILSGVFLPALPEFIRLLAHAGCHWPHEFLPELLERCSRDPELYRRARPVLSRRADWLAAQHPAWRVLAPLAASDWPTAGFRERRLLIQTLRETEPGAARRLVQTSWLEETADNRRILLETFREGLSNDDIPFLESAALDRSRAVRLPAFRLLALLPESPTCQTLLSAARNEPGFPPRANVEPGNDFLRRLAGLDPHTDATRLADRLLRLTPPSAWEHIDEKALAALLEADRHKDGLIPFLPALLESAAWHGALSWQTALAAWLSRHPDDSAWAADETPDFLDRLPASLWNQTLANAAGHGRLSGDTPWVQALLRSRHPWGKDLFLRIMSRLGGQFADALYLPEPYPRNLVSAAAYACTPTDALQWLQEPLARLRPDRPWRRLLEQMQGIVRFRQELGNLLAPETNISA